MTSPNSSKPRMMFSYWDGGRGHYTRMMTLANEAHSRGSEIGIITSERYANEIGSLGLASEVYIIPNRPPSRQAPYDLPLYSHAFRHAQRQRGLGFQDTDWLRGVTNQEIDAIKNFKPDVLINDYRDTVRTSAEACDVPVVGVAETTGHPKGYPFGWWLPTGDLTLPDCRESFNQIRAEHKLEPIADERELFSGDLHIIPSSPSLDPLKEASDNTHYVGRICQWNPPEIQIPYLTSSRSQRRIYSYVGDPSRQDYGFEPMMSEVINQNPDLGFYIAGNTKRYPTGFEGRQAEGSLVMKDFLPSDPLIEDSDVVLCHGGQGTVMQALILGKPLICVGPYHSQMTTVFRPLEQAQAGIMLNHSESELERKPAPDLGEGIDILGYWKTEITSEKIDNAIAKVINNPEYTAQATRLGKELSALGGVTMAVDLCESLA